MTIATRVQTASGTSTISEEPTDLLNVKADIQPIGAMTFLMGEQTDRPITHRIRMRWLDWVDQTHIVTRKTTRPDGTIRTEIFRVRRVKEIDGRKRFIEIEAEQESRA